MASTERESSDVEGSRFWERASFELARGIRFSAVIVPSDSTAS